MFPTVEVRWFYKGVIPDHIHTWFERLAGSVMEQEQRVDLYLAVNRDDLGIKLREGRIEIKQRWQTDGVIRLSDRVAGRMERWRKWGFALAADGGLDSAGWVAVTKTRRLRSYCLARNGAILSSPLGQGCEVELTQVDALGSHWWTVALEAYAEGAGRADALRLVGRYVFRSAGPSGFEGRDSYSYPAWLAELAGGE